MNKHQAKKHVARRHEVKKDLEDTRRQTPKGGTYLEVTQVGRHGL
jgi:hypothetical protein